MYEAYSASHRYADVSASEKTLRTLMLNNDEFLSDCSFISKAGDKIVSACLLTGDSVRAEVTELFTHPLHRARVLATTEVIVATNQLA
jgi:hypothetical protein